MCFEFGSHPLSLSSASASFFAVFLCCVCCAVGPVASATTTLTLTSSLLLPSLQDWAGSFTLLSSLTPQLTLAFAQTDGTGASLTLASAGITVAGTIVIGKLTPTATLTLTSTLFTAPSALGRLTFLSALSGGISSTLALGSNNIIVHPLGTLVLGGGAGSASPLSISAVGGGTIQGGVVGGSLGLAGCVISDVHFVNAFANYSMHLLPSLPSVLCCALLCSALPLLCLCSIGCVFCFDSDEWFALSLCVWLLLCVGL
jgi:hypothetical protein